MNNRVEEAEEWISELEDRVMESTEPEQKRERIIQHKNSYDLSELSDSIRCNNINIIGVQEKRDKRVKKIYLKK